MRKLLSLLLLLVLLTAWGSSARAQQGQAQAILYPVDARAYPVMSAFLDVFDASNAFVGGLKTSDLSILEDGKALPVTSLSQLAVPAQIVVAINPGPAFGLHDTGGLSHFGRIVQALNTWAQARPAGVADDLSLVTIAGPIIAHANVKDWLVSLNSFQPDFHSTTPNVQSLSIALDTITSQTAQSGMKRAVLFITPHMDDPNLDVALQPLIQRAVQNRVHVFVWYADLDSYASTTSAAAFSQLAQATGGSFAFSSTQTFPDPEGYFAPLRSIYLLKYSSAVTSGGQHTVGVQVTAQGTSIKSDDQTFSVDIQPPNPIFISPPLQITRHPPDADPYNTQILEPATQEIDIIIDFPDGHPRALTSTTLFVDGQVVAQNTKAPFDKFVWDLGPYGVSGSHKIKVQAADVLGLTKDSMEIPLTLTIVQPPRGISAVFARYHQQIPYAAVAAAGLLLLLVLFIGRLQTLAAARRAALAQSDPLTQAVALTPQPPVKVRKKRARKQPAAEKTVRAAASLIRLRADLEPLTAKAIPLAEKETTFGTDPAQSAVVLEDASLAPLHARILLAEDGSFSVADAGTIAGTWVNYDPVGPEGHLLQHGDVLHFGQLAFRFQLKNPPPAKEPKISTGVSAA